MQEYTVRLLNSPTNIRKGQKCLPGISTSLFSGMTMKKVQWHWSQVALSVIRKCHLGAGLRRAQPSGSHPQKAFTSKSSLTKLFFSLIFLLLLDRTTEFFPAMLAQLIKSLCICPLSLCLLVMKSWWKLVTIEECTLKIVNDCLNAYIYSYVETSGDQNFNLYLNVVHFFNTSVN